MVTPQQIKALKDASVSTLSILEMLEKQAISKISSDKMKAGQENLRVLIAQLENPAITEEQFQDIAEKLKGIGYDIIEYGKLVLPRTDNN